MSTALGLLVVAVDPGPERSAFVAYDAKHHYLAEFGIRPTRELVTWLPRHFGSAAHLAVEMVASYGMPVGSEIFETCVWSGRIIEAWDARDRRHSLVYRRDVKLHLCGQARAKDANVRQALLDLFPRSGGGKTPQIGTKASPGPLYGVSRDVWAAIGVAVTYAADPGAFHPLGAEVGEP